MCLNCNALPCQSKKNERSIVKTCLNPSFKGIVSAVLIARGFHSDDFQRFGDLKTRFLHKDHFCLNKQFF
jgi:hypothetical protein